MKKIAKFILAFSLLLLFSGILAAAAAKGGGKPNPEPGQNDERATPNLSFPVIATDIIDVFYEKDAVYADDGVTIIDWVLALDENGLPIPIDVTEAFNEVYGGSYPGNDDIDYTEYIMDDENWCPVGTTDPTPMAEWLEGKEPWYAQPATTDSTDPNHIWNADFVTPPNSWQADWEKVDGDFVEIDFVDWGNPMENINPIVGLRFPVEVALYTKLDENEKMTAYKVACLEYPSSRDEVFGTSTLGEEEGSHTNWVYFATVLTNRFTAEVENPDKTTSGINLAPGIGPSGKMNFASAGGGWIPTMPGWHRIWLHVSDPLIILDGAIVNNDEHYVMHSGCMAETLSKNKVELSGIVGKSTYIDVLVVKPSGKKSK